MTEQRPKIRTFLPAMWPAFFIRVRPASRNANPACMNITSTAVMTTQIVDAAINKSEFLGTSPDPLELAPGSMMDDVRDLGRPDEPVARLVATACGVDDGIDHELRQSVLDDEDQHRLRQE